jgi:cytochrome c-type biogenesis protein CcmE
VQAEEVLATHDEKDVPPEVREAIKEPATRRRKKPPTEAGG